ncbi:unnamed protein product [Schistosoma turkestanicum]|nr:unnamed protein product [Schistosoma turkestanicum]
MEPQKHWMSQGCRHHNNFHDSQANQTFFHELVFCFNKSSSLINCTSDYADDFQLFELDNLEFNVNITNEQMESQVLCGESFKIPEFKFAGQMNDTEAR